MPGLTRVILLFVISFSSFLGIAAPAKNSDPYNALIWTPQKTGGWFEWWYYKVVVPGTAEGFYFTYGVVNPGVSSVLDRAARAHVSVGSFADHSIVEELRPTSDFRASRESTLVEIGENLATDRHLRGHLVSESGDAVSWNLNMETDWKFNAMGWGMFRDWLFNIYWYPAQASAWMSGEINYKGRIIHLDHAPAYQDRNWGTSFPKWWTWIVSNHFKNSPGTVLASGGGRPKLIGGVDPLEGVTIGFRHQGQEFTFRPTSGDRVHVNIHFGVWEVQARNRRGERIVISATAPRSQFMDLAFMTPQGQMFHDYEALKGHIQVQLYQGDSLLADVESDEGGIEYGSAEEHTLESIFNQSIQLL